MHLYFANILENLIAVVYIMNYDTYYTRYMFIFISITLINNLLYDTKVHRTQIIHSKTIEYNYCNKKSDLSHYEEQPSSFHSPCTSGKRKYIII